jgi:hypothetical protein
VIGTEGSGFGFVGGSEVVVEAGEGVNVAHHAGRAVDDGEMVTEEVLGPPADLMDLDVVLQDLLDGTAVAEPVEKGAPQVTPILADGPAPAGRFAHEGVEVAFPLGAATTTESNGAETGAAHEAVEEIVTAGREEGGGGGVVVGWLHQNVPHAIGGPIRLQEARLGLVVASKDRVAGDGSLELVE